jgi:cytochrome oxidase assembly protein ShyY1
MHLEKAAVLTKGRTVYGFGWFSLALLAILPLKSVTGRPVLTMPSLLEHVAGTQHKRQSSVSEKQATYRFGWFSLAMLAILPLKNVAGRLVLTMPSSELVAGTQHKRQSSVIEK